MKTVKTIAFRVTAVLLHLLEKESKATKLSKSKIILLRLEDSYRRKKSVQKVSRIVQNNEERQGITGNKDSA